MSSVNARRTAKLEREAAPIRLALCEELGRCEGDCGKRKRVNELACHEIANGNGIRPKALTARFAILVLCGDCHRIIQSESKERQLARLYHSRASDLDLVAFNRLRGRADTAITFADIEPEIEFLLSPPSR